MAVVDMFLPVWCTYIFCRVFSTSTRQTTSVWQPAAASTVFGPSWWSFDIFRVMIE